MRRCRALKRRLESSRSRLAATQTEKRERQGSAQPEAEHPTRLSRGEWHEEPRPVCAGSGVARPWPPDIPGKSSANERKTGHEAQIGGPRDPGAASVLSSTMAVARSRGAVMVLLVSILCREGLCFQAFQAPALMAHKSGFASVCSFRAFSVGAFRTAGSPRHLAGQGGRRCRGAGKGGVQGLSAKATPDYYKVRWPSGGRVHR